MMVRIVLLVLLVSGSSAALLDPASTAAPAACADAPERPACAPDGLVSFVLPSGRRVYTHGPDAPHDHQDGWIDDLTEQVPEPTLRTYPYVCVTDAATDYHNHVVYARASDAPDRFAQYNVTLREWALAANTQLHADSLAFDVATDYRMLCDADGQLRIDSVVLPTPRGQATVYDIFAEVEAAGYASPRAKYWILYDDTSRGFCGEGEFYPDPVPGPENKNNAGPSYAATYPNPLCDRPWVTLMHENGHNLGAVQPTSPNSDRVAHCADGADVMCYIGPGARHTLNCPHLRFDCGHDDYFHPKPAQVSYLSLFWNLGSRHNRFFSFADVPAPPTGVEAAPAGSGQVQVSWTPPTTSPAPTLYRVYHGSGNLSTMAPSVEVPATQTSVTFASTAGFYLVTAVAASGESRPSDRASPGA